MVEPLVRPVHAITVRVLVDGVDSPGLLHAWRHSPDGSWRAYVSWHAGVGMQHLTWVDGATVRRR